MPHGYVYVLPACSRYIASRILYIYILRGVLLPLLIQLQWQSQGHEERNEHGDGLPPFFCPIQFISHVESMAISSSPQC